MDHAEAVGAQIAQEIRHHGRGPGLGIVEQDDPFAGGLKPRGGEIEFLLGRHLVPVAGPEVRPEHHDAARLQIILQSGGRLEIGEAEKRRAGRVGRLAMQGRFIRGDPAIDVVQRLRGWDLAEIGVRP